MTVLLLTRSAEVLDLIGRLAAAAGVEPVVSHDPVACLPAWSSATVVLVGADIVADASTVSPPRRPGVHVVGAAALPDAVFRSALGLGAETVLELPAAAEWLIEVLTDVGDERDPGLVVGVVGGAGGAGATTLAVALAQAGAARGPTLLVDTDPIGAGLDRMLGLEGVGGVRWHDLHHTSGRLGARALRDSVPRRGPLGVLGWASATGAELDPGPVREALSAARRGHDLVVVDLARHGGAVVAEAAGRCDRILVVCPATVVGTAATVRVLAALDCARDRAGLVLRPGAVPDEDVEAATGLPVVGRIGRERGLAEAVDLGLGPLRSRRGALARACRDLLAGAAA